MVSPLPRSVMVFSKCPLIIPGRRLWPALMRGYSPLLSDIYTASEKLIQNILIQ